MKRFLKLVGSHSRWLCVIAFVAVIGFSMAACGGDDDPTGGNTGGNTGGGDGTTTAVTGVTLSPTMLSLKVGNSQALTATVAPDNATNKAVTWSSSNTAIATVTDGTVTAVAEGTATITVTTADGNKTATCAVTVSPLLPEEKSDQDRWYSFYDTSSTVTITHSVANDGVCTITVGGTAMPPQDDGTGAIRYWASMWKALVGYPYTVEKNKIYTYTFEAWTDGDDRNIVVEWFYDEDNSLNQNKGYGDGITLDFPITSERTTYTITGEIPIPKSGIQDLHFYCANQTGTFYVKIISITEE